MRRDWDIIRTILHRVEAMSASDDAIRSDGLDDVESTVAGYHMWLLLDAGFVNGTCLDTGRGQFCNLRELTWKGCEFLDTIRTDKAWERIKETAEQKGLELTFDSIKALAKFLLEQFFS